MTDIISDHKIIKTRKPHNCHGCSKRILAGEMADVSVHKADGEIYSLYECTECIAYVAKYPECRESEHSEGYLENYVSDDRDFHSRK